MIRQNNSHFCKNCLRWSHARCRGIESKFVKNVWLCKSCCRDNFPLSDFETEPLRTGSDLSNLKSYFNRLNTTSANDEDLDHDDISYINCKYYSCDDRYEGIDRNLSIPSKDKSLSFFHSNISSLEKHFDEFSNLFETLNHSFDVIGVSETRLSSSSAGNTSLPGYSFLGVSSESIAGGVGLYISAKITFKPRTDLSKILYSSTNLESIFIELIFKGKENIIVGCVYKHPSFNIDDFNTYYLSPFLSKLNKEEKSIVLLGDFNINLLNCNSNCGSSSFLDLLGSC